MRIYRMKVKKDGQQIQIKNWYADVWFRNKSGKPKKHKLPLFKSLTESERFADKLDALVGAVSAGRSPDAQQQAWLQQLTPKMLLRLARIGLVEQSRVEASKDLMVFLDDYKQSLLHRGNTDYHCQRTASRLKEVFVACKFDKVGDIDASKVERYLGEQVQSGRLHPRTVNNFIISLKAIGNWLVQNDKTDKSPFRNMRPVKVTERKRPRRAMPADELAKLIAHTKAADDAYDLSGHERSILYRFAACSGLRVGEIRKLTVGDFNAEEKTITVQAAFSKNRKRSVLPLRADVVAELQELTAGKLPTLPIFGKIPQFAARMIREDCEGAGIDTVGVDFHCLRYSFASMLVNSDVAPKTAMELLRHSDVRLTMQLYGQSYKSLERAAIDSLPSFDKMIPDKKQA